MKKIIVAASIIIGCSIFAFADTVNKTDCSGECPKGNENCVCVPTPNGGCVCVPKAQNAIGAKPNIKIKSNCPNTPDCICE